jgi:serine phosphatase RsbU (regulator of sigma subunit)
MFLGASIDLPYEETSFLLLAGDVRLLMTDGLTDRLNA